MRKGWQIRLRTMLILVAAFAVWVTYWSNRRQIPVLQERITAMQRSASELVVDDLKKAAVVKLAEYWYDENRWDVYLPEGTFQLCLATRQIDEQGFPEKRVCRPIQAGRHRIALEQQQPSDVSRVTVTWDQTLLLSVDEPREWSAMHGSTGGSGFTYSHQIDAGQPIVLFRRRFSRQNDDGSYSPPETPCDGVLLWIERVVDPGPPK